MHLAKDVYNYIETLPALNCSKLTIKTIEQSVKSVQSLQYRQRNDVINIGLASLVLTLKQMKHSVLRFL